MYFFVNFAKNNKMEIELENDVKMLFINTLIQICRDQTRAKTMPEHLLELDMIENNLRILYSNENSVKLQLSESFFKTWIWRTFDELFNSFGQRLNKTQAKKMNRFYESIFKDYNELFLSNYNSFSD